jgi:hypothetical protein
MRDLDLRLFVVEPDQFGCRMPVRVEQAAARRVISHSTTRWTRGDDLDVVGRVRASVSSRFAWQVARDNSSGWPTSSPIQ